MTGSGLRTALTATASLAARNDPITACHPAAIPIRAYAAAKSASASVAAPVTE
jgi:hypothetical protein